MNSVLDSVLPKSQGGTKFGVHFLGDFASCARKGYLRYLKPLAEGQGIEPITTPEPLLLGDLYHHAIEAYYRSAIRDGEDTGERLVGVAFDAIALRVRERAHEFSSPEVAEALRLQAHVLIERYDATFGPRGALAEYPSLKVLCDSSGEPLIEREFTLDIGQGYIATCRVDQICEWNGWVVAHEYKTTAGSLATTFQRLKMSAQTRMELLVLKAAQQNGYFGDRGLNGVLYDLANKKWGPRSTQVPFYRDVADVSNDDLEAFRQDMGGKLYRLSQRVEEYQKAQAHVPEGIAALTYFGLDGLFNGACYSYGRACPYQPLCVNVGMEAGFLVNYRPRAKTEVLGAHEGDPE